MISKARLSVVFISTSSATGTGFIVDSDKGYILTNQHVVENHRTVNVTLHVHGSVSARVLVTDASRDMALIEVNLNSLGKIPALSFATSARVGESVVALGYPYPLSGGDVTVTRGIVSAYRTIRGVECIQTDAAINPGNSGGPLLNMKGEVVGMNTWGYFDKEGLNFAINYNVLSDRLSVMIAQAEVPATPVPTALPAHDYGPVSESIAHNPDDGLIGVFETEFWMTNGIIRATFFNPYTQSMGTWTNGFLFRHPNSNTFHVVGITSGGYWVHYLRRGGPENEQEEYDFSRHIATGEGDNNVITVAFNGNEGLLYVNDQEVATLDLSGLTAGGYVSVMANYHIGDGVVGYSTRFEDLIIWRAPD